MCFRETQMKKDSQRQADVGRGAKAPLWRAREWEGMWESQC